VISGGRRNTLPCREEPLGKTPKTTTTLEHPPEQGGNSRTNSEVLCASGTPSRMGRKRDQLAQSRVSDGNTLPHREEISRVPSWGTPRTEHPPEQGGTSVRPMRLIR